MEYIFGTVQRNGVIVENLKTIDEQHSNLSGFIQTVREYSDCVITDRFRIVEKYRSDKDLIGNCYDWYVIDEHYRYVDRVGAFSVEMEEKQTENELALAELAEHQATSQTETELALAELAEIVLGG